MVYRYGSMKKTKNEDLKRLSIKKFKSIKKLPVCIVLDNLRSLNNVGSCFRTADAFLIEKIYLTGFTGQPPHREINKTALGATETVEWKHQKNIQEVIKKLKKENWKIILIEQTNKSLQLNNFVPEINEKYCFVFGNEVFGISDNILKYADLSLEIPQFGTKHSINVAVSIGIVIWDYFLKTNTK